jgi:predicted nucleic acid-binding Zn ribbon protein
VTFPKVPAGRSRRRSRDADIGPRSLTDSLEEVTERLGATSPRSSVAVFSHWEEIVGTAVAAHATPVEMGREALVVVVDHPAWATQLRSLSGEILAKVAEVGGEQTPTVLRIRVRR